MLVLFDIDLTLLNTGGAGLAAGARALAELYGVADGLAGIPFAGRTDRAIFRDAYARLDRPGHADADFDAAVRAYEAAYVRHLPAALREAEGVGRALPGALELVRRLAAEPRVAVGVATGNFRRGARLKLRHYGFPDDLCEGGFGDDADDRGEMVAEAAQRLGPGDPVIVVGDTPLDIGAALANGFVGVGVATGHFSAADLRRAGAGLVLEDLADVDRVAESLFGLARDRSWGPPGSRS